MGYDTGEIKNKWRESNAAIAINQDARRVPLVNSRKAREIARGIIRHGGWPIPAGQPEQRDNGSIQRVAATPVLCLSRHREKEVIIPRRNEASH